MKLRPQKKHLITYDYLRLIALCTLVIGAPVITYTYIVWQFPVYIEVAALYEKN